MDWTSRPGTATEKSKIKVVAQFSRSTIVPGLSGELKDYGNSP
jgi:hypothetical protein